MKIFRPICACFVVLGCASVAQAANRTWTAAVSGDFGAAANWTGGVPGAADTATFNVAGPAYTVTFDNNPNPLANPVQNQDLFFSAGTVTFTSGSGGPYNYKFTSSGGDDAQITGGTLNLGTSSNPLHLTMDDDLLVRGGSTLNVLFGSQVNTLDLLLATVNGGGNGDVVVDGTGSQLNVTNGFNLAQNGNTGTLTYRNAAQGILSGTVNLAPSSNPATLAVLNVQSDADLNTASLAVGNGGGAGTGTLNIHGAGSTLTQSGASTLSVGTASACIGNINIGTTTTGGTLTTGTGTLTIRATGAVNIGSGANTGILNALGDVTIDGGVLTRGSGSTFTLASGKTMTVQNGGRASFTGGYTTASNAIYNISGANSKLETLTLPAFIHSGAQVNVGSGGLLSASSFMDVGTNGNGTLTVDGTGSSAVGNFNNHFWGFGASAIVTFSNDALGNFGGSLFLAETTTAGTTADVDILSGADLNVGNLRLAALGGATTSATLTISDAGSTVTLTPSSNLTIGHSATGTAVINVLDDAALTVGAGGTTTLNATGTINIDGGTVDLKTLNDSGGAINFTAGSLRYLGDLTVGVDGLLGADLTLSSNRQLTLSGTTTIDPSRTLTLFGGTFSTGGLAGTGEFAFITGTLEITGPTGLTIGAGGPLGATLLIDASRALEIANTLTLSAGSHLAVAGGFGAGNIVNNGDFVVIDTAIDGPVVNNNAVTVVGTVDFDGLVSGPGDFFGPGTANFNGGMAPGASPAEVNFEGSLGLTDTNTLFIEIGGTTPGSQYDTLDISGSAELGGTLDVELINGFNPALDDAFEIITAAGGVSGMFDTLAEELPALSSGLEWAINYNANIVVLQVVSAGLPGDFNFDGTVDAADYVVWRKTGSGNSQGYIEWRENFGEGMGAGGGSAGASPSETGVPEPATLVLLIFAAAGWCLRRGRAA